VLGDTEEAIRVAAKLATDAGDHQRARAPIDLLDGKARSERNDTTVHASCAAPMMPGRHGFPA
jgi:hypothetical protein